MTRCKRLCMTLLTLATTTMVSPYALACPQSGGGYPVYQPVYRPVYRPIASPPVVRRVTQMTTPQSNANQSLTAIRSQVSQARTAFTARNYGTALELMNKVVKQLPQNNEALQFRSLIHFALADDKAAAADAYEALKLGAAWNATAITTLYGDAKRYEAQLAALKLRAESNPDSLEVHFLLAYQSLVNGDLKTGEKELEEVLRIRPDEPLSSKLLIVVKDLRSKSNQTTASTN